MDVGRVVFSFCCLGALFGSSFSFCTSRCTVRRDKFSPVCLAHPLRCCKKKKKRQARQAAHRKKSNNRYHSCNPCPHYCTSGQILPCLPGAPASMLQEKKKRQARQAAHHKKSNDRYHSCNPRPHYCTSAQILSCLPGAPASMLQGKTTCTTGSAPQKVKQPFSTTAVPRPYSVATNSLMSAWRTRLVECAAIIAIFAFAR